LGGSGGALTTSVNVVIDVVAAPVPVTVIEYEPVGVEADVRIVKMLVNGGLPEEGLKVGFAPEGRSEMDRLTL